MKQSIIFIVVLFALSSSSYSHGSPSLPLDNEVRMEDYMYGLDEVQKALESDSIKKLVIGIGERKFTLSSGNTIKVKSNGEKYKGKLQILNDSTISIGSNSILLSQIDLIVMKLKPGRLLPFLVTLPLQVFGGYLVFDGVQGRDVEFVIIGATMIGITAIPTLFYAKRYKALKTFARQDGEIKRKYTYSIE